MCLLVAVYEQENSYMHSDRCDLWQDPGICFLKSDFRVLCDVNAAGSLRPLADWGQSLCDFIWHWLCSLEPGLLEGGPVADIQYWPTLSWQGGQRFTHPGLFDRLVLQRGQLPPHYCSVYYSSVLTLTVSLFFPAHRAVGRQAQCYCSFPWVASRSRAYAVPLPQNSHGNSLHHTCHSAGTIPLCWECWLLQQPGKGEGQGG